MSIEVDVDSRGRVALGKVIENGVRRYRVEQLPEGELHLIPLVSLSRRELSVLADPARVASIREGVEQAKNGQVISYEAGHFTRLAKEQGIDLEADD